MEYQNNVYKPSGFLGPAVALVPLAGIAGIIALSFAYAYVSVYSPIVGYISLLFTGGFAFAAGVLLSKLGLWGKCRNTRFMLFTGFALGLLALYVSWVVFLYALFQKEGDASTDFNLVDLTPKSRTRLLCHFSAV